MKKHYLMSCLILLVAFSAVLNGQNDTILFQDFQTALVDGVDLQVFPGAPDSDELWISFDEDGILDANGREQNWYWDYQFVLPDSIPVGDTNYVFQSSSWLTGFDTSNSNWLVSPLIYIGDDQATLHWKSSPYQGPRYMDGYSVKILTGNSDHNEAESIETVFRAAEMNAILGANESLDPADFEFGTGYIHAQSYTDSLYFLRADTSGVNFNSDFNVGILEPHSVSLSGFSEQWVYIAFHHDSADDNLIEVDDILVMGNVVTSTTDKVQSLRFVTYPNPVSNHLNVMFRTEKSSDLKLELFNQSGQKMDEIQLADGYVGEYNEQFDLRDLPSGNYTVVLTADDQVHTKKIVKK